MPSYMENPQIKIVVNATEIPCEDAKITRLENGFDTAIFTIKDRIDREGSKYYPTVITDGKPIECYLKAALDADWVLVFKGVIRFLHASLSEAGELLRLTCAGAGYGFAETVCAEEYGSQSRNSLLYSIGAILTNSAKGIIPKYVNNILGSDTESGYNYSSVVESISGVLQYAYFPYKPCNKAIADLCDLLQAIKGTTAGPHWIVTPGDKFLLATIGAHPSAVENEGWTTWFKKGANENESRNLSTLTQGVDFKEFDFQPLAPEANYILYYGILRKPGSGDYCENNAALWGENIIGFTGDCTITNDTDAQSNLTSTAAEGQKLVNVEAGSKFKVNDLVYLTQTTSGNEEHIIDSISNNQLTMVNNLATDYYTAQNAKVVKDNVRIGSFSIKSYSDTNGHSVNAYYPLAKNLALNIDKIGSQNSIPLLDFYIRIDENCDADDLEISLWNWTDIAHYGYFHREITTLITKDKWSHVTLPIGTYYKRSSVWDKIDWTVGWGGQNLGDWSKIDVIHFDCGALGSTRPRMWIDGLSINGQLIRIAKNSTKIGTNKVKMKVITDDIGKDDSLKATGTGADSGTMAQLAYAELLRCQNRITVGYVVTPCLKDLLPGQFVHIRAKQNIAGNFNIERDFRVTKLIHDMNNDKGLFTISYLTDDLANSYPRVAYDDVNKIMAAIRPEYQDRQAASLKVGTVDIGITKLEMDYPSD